VLRRDASEMTSARYSAAMGGAVLDEVAYFPRTQDRLGFNHV
jgi:hypothetical protein